MYKILSNCLQKQQYHQQLRCWKYQHTLRNLNQSLLLSPSIIQARGLSMTQTQYDKNKEFIRIGCGSGFWGDTPTSGK